jgi:hypothetical protein
MVFTMSTEIAPNAAFASERPNKGQFTAQFTMATIDGHAIMRLQSPYEDITFFGQGFGEAALAQSLLVFAGAAGLAFGIPAEMLLAKILAAGGVGSAATVSAFFTMPMPGEVASMTASELGQLAKKRAKRCILPKISGLFKGKARMDAAVTFSISEAKFLEMRQDLMTNKRFLYSGAFNNCYHVQSRFAEKHGFPAQPRTLIMTPRQSYKFLKGLKPTQAL